VKEAIDISMPMVISTGVAHLAMGSEPVINKKVRCYLYYLAFGQLLSARQRYFNRYWYCGKGIMGANPRRI